MHLAQNNGISNTEKNAYCLLSFFYPLLSLLSFAYCLLVHCTTDKGLSNYVSALLRAYVVPHYVAIHELMWLYISLHGSTISLQIAKTLSYKWVWSCAFNAPY